MVIDPLTRERGCDRCTGPIMVKLDSPAGLVELCWDHALRSMPGIDSTWLEDRHAPFEDHLLDAFQRGVPADRRDTRNRLNS